MEIFYSRKDNMESSKAFVMVAEPHSRFLFHSRWVIDHRSDEELSSSSRNDQTSLGEFQVRTSNKLMLKKNSAFKTILF